MWFAGFAGLPVSLWAVSCEPVGLPQIAGLPGLLDCDDGASYFFHPDNDFQQMIKKYWTPYLMHFYPMKRLSPIDLSQQRNCMGGETLCWNNTAFFPSKYFHSISLYQYNSKSTCKWKNKWKLSNIIHPYLHSNAEMLLASSVMSRVVWCVVDVWDFNNRAGLFRFHFNYMKWNTIWK